MTKLAKECAKTPLLLVQMELHAGLSGQDSDGDAAALVRAAVEMGADVVGVNCCSPWEATAFLDAVQDLEPVASGAVVLSAMPNAGGFQRIGRRHMTSVNAEYMGRLAKELVYRGVRLIGGCCEVHPPHIAEMGNYMHPARAGGNGAAFTARPAIAPIGDGSKRENGRFSRKIVDGEFAVSVEMMPVRGTAPKTLRGKVEIVGEISASGLADALDITDGSRGISLMAPGDFIALVRERLGWSRESGDGLELVPHFTMRDLNVMGVQSRLLGYWARGINNVVVITGDPPKMSPTYPRSSGVFDLDSVAVIHYLHSALNAGVDFGGQPLGRHRDPRTNFTVGTGFEPEAINMSRELDRLRQKIEAGADYVMTQPAFREEPLSVLESYRAKTPILVGVMVLTSLEHALRVGQVPGVVVPQEVYECLGGYEELPDQAKAGQEIAIEQIEWIRSEGWAGLYLMSPASYAPVVDVLRMGLG